MAQQSDHEYDPLGDEGFKAFIMKLMKETNTPGVAVAVVKGDQTWCDGWGVADLKTQEPVTPHTLFLTCSTTKAFTAALAAKVVHREDKSKYGDIKWSTKIADLIRDDFVLQDEYATSHLTLEDALSHRTGMPRHELSWTNGDPSLREMTRSLRHLPLHNEIRTTFEYCNLMYHTVAHALQTVTKRTMGGLLDTWLWKPLGMNETVWRLGDAHDLAAESGGKINMARGYQWDPKSKSNYETPWSSLPPPNGAGGIISNVLDYSKWIRQFLHPNEKVLPAAAMKELAAPRIPVHDRKPYQGTAWYGLGLDSGIYRSYVMTSHSGGLAGYTSKMLWIPDLDWGCVVMTNSYALASETITWRLVDDSLGTPESERFDAAGAIRGFIEDTRKKSQTARDRLYPSIPAVSKAALRPALAMEAYEGTYSHPAYGPVILSVQKTEQEETSKTDVSSEQGGPSFTLAGKSAAKSFLDMSITLKHVTGEHWLARWQSGPGTFGDSPSKARFEITPEEKISGLWWQAEEEIEELSWFGKTS